MCSRRKRGQQIQGLGRSKGGFSTKIHLNCDAFGNPTEFIITGGEVSDSPLLPRLIDGRNAAVVMADKGYDSDANLEAITAQNAEPCVPPKSNRTSPQHCDYTLYKERRHVECLIGKLKYFRRIFSRFDKYASHFLSFIQFAATLQWLK
jgi:transposase